MKPLKWAVLGLVIVAGGMQLVRIPSKTNPPTDPEQTVFAKTVVPEDVAAILKRSCWDCHSNETVWPWYADVAPVMWSVRGHVASGRAHVNFSEWGKYSPDETNEIYEGICKEVREREMPLPIYLKMHSNARLSDADIASLCRWAGSQTETDESSEAKRESEEHEGE